MAKKPYDQRTDLEQIQSQWNKLSGLHRREEWSATVVRAATAAELAANLAVRKEFGASSKLSADVIDSFLLWANGLAGKVDRLLIPLSDGKKHAATVRRLKSVSVRINQARNKVVHQGRFCNKTEATAVVRDSREFVEGLVRVFHPKFELKDKS